MGDAISRQAAIAHAISGWTRELEGEKWIRVSEVRENRHGQWKMISPARIYECSECGQNVMTNDIESYKYCHGCGADMREEEDG